MSEDGKDRRTFLLGAGFSYHAGLPLMRDFLTTIISYARGRSSEHTGRGVVFEEGIPHFERYMEWKHEEQGPEYHSVGIEELLIELAEGIGRSDGVINGIDIVRVNNLIRFGIVDYVLEATDEASGLEKIQNLIKKADGCTIISFNWDTLVEKAAIQLGLTCEIAENGVIHLIDSTKRNAIDLIKLHGSVQWIESNPSPETSIKPHHKELFEEILGGKIFAVKGYDSVDFITPLGDIPAIVTPSKDIRRSTLGELWNIAQQKLHEVLEVTVVGYSFPSYDEESIRLMRSWADASKGRRLSKTLELIDPDRHIHERVIELFGNAALRIHSQAASFEDSWLASPETI